MNLWLAAGLLIALRPAVAMFEPQIISFEQLSGALDISKPVIVVDGHDYTGVQIAAHTLAADFGNVTRAQPTVQVLNGTNSTVTATSAIIIGTLSNSPLLQTLVSSGKLNASAIEGKWESFVTSLVTQPLDGIDSALVIAGSDKRGAIFGAYTVSEQIGVSPWYWWADVPILSKSKIFALPTATLHGEPSVKFRGIFINDEAPALTSWVLEKFGSKYNVEFYKHVFELLLRLKANYLWPAMWPGYPYPGNSFFVDDPLNQKTADDYGIVVSTSHHEPMQRATNEWLQSNKGQWDWASNKANISQFFREGAERAKGYDSYFTVGMRGDGDSPISGTDPKALMEDIINTQRSIITEVYGNSTAVNQVWALYKEVQAIYDQGLQVPDDITLLFADDNFGNIRRLATQTERQRSGGSGIYYHMEYVGSPISYKWLNTNSLGKIHHQLSLAKMTGTDRIWVFNVADIKPMEVPLTFALTFAYNHTTISTESIPEYLLQYARREIPDANEADVKETRDLLLSHSRLMGIRKHEHTEQSVFSVLNYREADRWASVWDALNKRADSLSARISQASSAAFFQLVLQPIKASQIFYTLRVAQARNNLFGQERANAANVWADRTLELFDKDYDVEEEYHSLLHGKWNHIMAQAHYGYVSSWVPPIRNMITGMYYVQRRQKSVPAVGNIGVRIDGSAGSHVGLFNEGNHLSQPSREPSLILPLFSPYNPVPSTWVLLYARGPGSMRWFSSTSQPWVSMSPSQGTLDDHTTDQLVNVTVDWSSVPDGFNSSVILKINSTDAGSYEEVTLPLVKVAPAASFVGHVQADGVVSILAPHFVASTAASDGTTYHVLPHLGRSIEYSGAVGLLPYNTTVSSIPNGPYLDYSFYLFNPVPSTLTVTLYFTMCQDPLPDAPLKYGLSLDGGAVNTTQLIPTPATAGDLPAGWTTVVQNLVWDKAHTFTGVGSGGHTLRYWAGNVGVLLEKMVVNIGGLRTSYLGPPESMRLGL